MFIIYLPALANLLDETYKMENTLNTEMENQLHAAKKLQESWFGESAETFQYVMNREMQTGSYQSAYSYVKGLRELLEYFYPTVKQLIARCEQIGEQLKQDAYTEPMLGVHDELYLTFNYDYISSLNGDCVMALNSAEKAKKVLQRMMEESARWINWCREEDELYYAWKKMQRLEHYREEFNTLAHRLSTLEYEMTSEMDRIMARNDEFLLPDANLATKDMEQRKHDMTTFDEIKEVESIYDMDKVIAIMNSEAETWTVEDCEYIAGAFNYFLDKKDVMGITYFMQGLMEDEHRNYRVDGGVLPDLDTTYYEVEPNKEKLQKLVGQLDKIKQATAYKTLCNLSEVEKLRIACDDGYGNGVIVEASGLKEEEPFMTICLFSASEMGRIEKVKKAAKVYVQGIETILTPEIMGKMNHLGYNQEDVVKMMEQYELNMSYEEYEKLSLEDMELYDSRAKDYAFALIPENAEFPCEYTVPIGYDMTLTYSATTKGTVPNEIVNSTLEYQRTELKSISLSQGNTDVAIGKDNIGIGQKIDADKEMQVGGAMEFSMKSIGVAVSIVTDEMEKGLKYVKNTDGSNETIYYVETKLEENTSIYSEVKIAKDGNDDIKNWEPIRVPLIEELPEEARKIIDNTFFSIPTMPKVPIKVY